MAAFTIILPATTSNTQLPQVLGGAGGPWNPYLLGTALLLWFESDSGVAQTSNQVSEWDAKVPSSPTLALEPLSQGPAVFVPGAQNGLPAIQASDGPTNLAATFASANFEYNQPFSLVLAFRKDASSNAFEWILCYSLAGTYPGWAVDLAGGNLGLRVAHLANNAEAYAHGGTSLTSGTFYRAVITYDGSGTAAGIKLYLNGNAETMTTVHDNLGAQSIVATGQKLTFGGVDGTTLSKDSLLGFQIVNRVLTSDEISDEFAYLSTKYGV